eukprot:PhF_6_TR41307/c1_g1_i3/m.62558
MVSPGRSQPIDRNGEELQKGDNHADTKSSGCPTTTTTTELVETHQRNRNQQTHRPRDDDIVFGANHNHQWSFCRDQAHVAHDGDFDDDNMAWVVDVRLRCVHRIGIRRCPCVQILQGRRPP